MQDGTTSTTPVPATTKMAAAILVKKFFGMDIKEAQAAKAAMDDLSWRQLGSACARAQGLGPDAVSFEMVPY